MHVIKINRKSDSEFEKIEKRGGLFVDFGGKKWNKKCNYIIILKLKKIASSTPLFSWSH